MSRITTELDRLEAAIARLDAVVTETLDRPAGAARRPAAVVDATVERVDQAILKLESVLER